MKVDVQEIRDDKIRQLFQIDCIVTLRFGSVDPNFHLIDFSAVIVIFSYGFKINCSDYVNYLGSFTSHSLVSSSRTQI